MIKVLCVRTGQKYSPEYVFKLKNMVEKNLKQKHEFYCITENPAQVRGVETIPAPIQINDSWAKIGLFSPSLRRINKGDKCLFLDLDVIITGSLDDLIAGKLKEVPAKEIGLPASVNPDLWIAKDPRDPFNSSVMYWVHGTQAKIYGSFTQADIDRLRGDQNLIAEVVPDARTFKEGHVLSYKFDGVKDKDEKPQGAKVVLFHGKPKMHELPNVQWIKDNWK